MRTAVLALLAFCVLAPAAHADGFDTLQELASLHLRPAPLVPTTAPRPLDDIGTTLMDPTKSKRGGYGWRLVHYGPSGPDAVVALNRGEFSSMRAALKYFRLRGTTQRSTRVRGKRGYLLRSSHEATLLWNEDARVYWMGTGSPRKVTPAGLRAIASGLDRLGSNYIGSYFQPGTNNTHLGGVLVTTQRYVSGIVEFGTDNCVFNGFPGSAHGGSATFFLVALEGRDFTLPLNGPLVSPAGWNGQLTGAVAPSAINLSLQAGGTFDENACDTGLMSMSAPARDPL